MTPAAQMTAEAAPVAHGHAPQRRWLMGSTTWATMGHDGEVVEHWALDELAHAGPEHLDRDYVAGCDRKSGVDRIDDLAALRRHGIDETSSLVDLGAGTGTFAPLSLPTAAV